MLRVKVILALLAVLAASPLEKDEAAKANLENLRQMLEKPMESKEDEERTERGFERSLESSISLLGEMISKANPGLRSSKRSLEDMDVIDGDVKLDKESAAKLVEFYKRNPQFLRLNNNGTETVIPEPFDKRKVHDSPKWTFPIKYRIQLASAAHVALVRQAVSIWQQQTCITFTEATTITAPAINFKENESGCWSYVGKRYSGINDINLQNGCKYLGIVLHEIGHALGMWHEQSRPDRNDYVTVQTSNIRSGYEHNFLIKSSSLTYGTRYDYGSVMHYPDTAFAKSSGLKTIIAKQNNYERTMGQRLALSFYDIKAMNYHYCQSKCSAGLTWRRCKNGGYRNPKRCGRCKCPDGWIGRYCQYPKGPATSGCGRKYKFAKANYRYIRSPGYSSPGQYTTASECTWKIKAPVGKKVQLEFVGSFGITCNTRCLDFVEVRFKSLSATGPRFCCGTRPTDIMTSDGRVMLVLFRTNSNNVAKGFRARYKYV